MVQLSNALVLAASALSAVQAACVGPAVNVETVTLIKSFESFVPSPKPDPIGLPTVGYGHKCQKAGCAEVPFKFPLSEATATQLLQRDLVTAQNCIAADVKVRLNANQYGALVSWAFNIGCGQAKTSTLVKRLNAGEAANSVIASELPKWNKGGGKVLPGLTRRRAAEVKLAETATAQGALPAC